MRIALAAFALALVCGSVHAEETKDATPAEIEQIREAMADRLKDSDSAKFRNVRKVKDGSLVVVCGDVNAKNSYGGYVGFHKFMGSLFSAKESTNNKPFALIIGIDGEYDTAAKMCAEKGI